MSNDYKGIGIGFVMVNIFIVFSIIWELNTRFKQEYRALHNKKN